MSLAMKDFRVRNFLEDVLSPPDKEGVAPRTFGHLRMVLASKRKSVLFVSFPKCGWNWSMDVLGYCLVKSRTGAYEERYDGDGTLKERTRKPYQLFCGADSRARSLQKIRRMFPGVDIDYLLHSHGAWGESPLWGLDEAKTVFIVRNVPTNLFSFYKSRQREYASFREFVETYAMDRLLHFYNSWGEFQETPGTKHKSFQYEDMRSNPIPTFSAMYRFVFGLDVEEAVLREALEYFSFQRQKEREFKFEKDESKHFHFRGEADYTSQIDADTLDYIHNRIHGELRHLFGYQYPKPS